MPFLREAKTRLLTELYALPVPSISPHASTEEVANLKAHFDAVVVSVDNYLLAIGENLRRSTNAHVDITQFQNAIREATDGFARFEFDAVNDEIRTLAQEAA